MSGERRIQSIDRKPTETTNKLHAPDKGVGDEGQEQEGPFPLLRRGIHGQPPGREGWGKAPLDLGSEGLVPADEELGQVGSEGFEGGVEHVGGGQGGEGVAVRLMFVYVYA